jgi:zinc protease
MNMNARWTSARATRMVALVALLALLAPVTAHAQTAAPKKIVAIEGITEYRLDNGLRVLLFPDESSPNVTVNLTMFVGSRHEGYGETGMAHLLEHMVFKGTQTHPDVPKSLKDHGAQFNGTTWVDRTNYFETMRGTDENLEFGIRLEADRMVNSFVKREDLATEMTVVRNEFERGENDPENILSQRMMAVAYEWHNYGKSTIGNRSDIERVPIDRLQGFYKKYYRPENAMLVVAGRFDEAKALGYIAKYFGPLKNPREKLDTTYTEEPAQDGERVVTLRRVGKVGVVGAIYHIPAGSHDDYAACEMLNSILVSEPSGRLYQALVPTKKANSVSGVAFGWHDPGVFEFSAEVDPNKSLDAVRDTMTDVLEKLGTQKITDEEVERAKAKFKRDRDLLMTNSNRIGITLSDWGAKGDWRLFFLHRDRVAKVTPADVQRVAGKYLQRTNRTLGMFLPSDKAERADIPERPDVEQLVKDYKGGKTVVAGEKFDPSPENILKRTKVSGDKDGLQVALLPKKSRGEAVSLTLTLRFGNEKSLQGQGMAAELLAPMLMRGNKVFTRQQIQDRLATLGARMGAVSGAGSLTFSIETTKTNFGAVLALLKEVLQSPTFSADEFDILKREQLDPLKKAQSEPQPLASRFVRRALRPYPKDHVHYTPTIDEEIARLEATTVEQVKQLYAEQVGGQNAILVVVGDFDDNIESSNRPELDLASVLRKWKSKVAYERVPEAVKTDIAGKREVILTPDKANALYLGAHLIGVNNDDPDFAALDVANFIFGGGTLSSRLGNRVRQKEGLSYGVASMFGARAKDKAGSLTIFAICNPQNIDKVDKAITEEMDKILKDGVTSEEVAEAKKAYLEQRKVRRSTNAALAGMLSQTLEDGRTFAYHAELEKKVEALTLDDVNAAMRKYWQPKKLVIVRAGDFNKK